jgi:hypothetical protein
MQTANSILSTLIVIVIIAALIYRQIRPRRLSTRGLVIMPLIILYLLVQALPTFHPTMSKIEEITITAVVSLVLGILACRQLKVYASPKTGKAMASGSLTYFLWWLAAFAIKAGLSVAFGETDFSNVSQVEILIPVFLLVVTRSAYLYWKVSTLGLELHPSGKQPPAH